MVAPRDVRVLIPGACGHYFIGQRDFVDVITWMICGPGDPPGLARWASCSHKDRRRSERKWEIQREGVRAEEGRHPQKLEKARKWNLPSELPEGTRALLTL